MIKAGEVLALHHHQAAKQPRREPYKHFGRQAKILAQGQFICPEHEKRMKGSRPAEPGGKVEKITIVAAKRLEVKA